LRQVGDCGAAWTHRWCAFTRRFTSTHLAIDPVDLPILILELAAHVNRHVPQIANHRVHLAHILLHLILARVVRDLGDVAALRPETVAVVHHPLRLIVHNLAVVVALPRALVLLEAGASVRARLSRERRERLNRNPGNQVGREEGEGGHPWIALRIRRSSAIANDLSNIRTLLGEETTRRREISFNKSGIVGKLTAGAYIASIES